MALPLLEKLQALLLDQEIFLRISSDIVLHRDALEDGIAKIRQLFSDRGEFSAAEAKDALDTTRKFAIPFLEYLDQSKVTRRVGDKREMVDP